MEELWLPYIDMKWSVKTHQLEELFSLGHPALGVSVLLSLGLALGIYKAVASRLKTVLNTHPLLVQHEICPGNVSSEVCAQVCLLLEVSIA